MQPTKGLYLVTLLLSCCFVAFGQQSSIVIHADKSSLNDVLLTLRKAYNLQLSYNSKALTEFKISLADTFLTPETALAKLIEPFPLELEKVGDVFILLSATGENTNYKSMLVKGVLRDNTSGEILPYGTIFINNRLRITDALGRFSYIAFNDEPLHIEATFLGYNRLDSIYFPTATLTCYLQPARLNLMETTVTGDYVEYGLLSGTETGTIRLNKRIISSVGGNLNNAIYNVLKLQPGISGTSGATNFSMWGSYQGQNQTLFDGISIFNMSGENPLVHAVNPLVVKDILISKGTSGAQYGDYVGGVVEMTAIDGNYHKPVCKLSVDNLMVNGLLTSPITPKSALVVAYRRLWLQDANNNMRHHLLANQSTPGELMVYPNRKFQDLHLKYSSQQANGNQLAVSAYGALAQNDYSIEQQLNLYHTEKQQQYGMSGRYACTWFNGVNSQFLVAYSGYRMANNIDTTWQGERPVKSKFNNKIDEFKVFLDNRFDLSPTQFVEAGILTQFYQNSLDFSYNKTDIWQQQSNLVKFGTYIRNHIHANKVLTMDIGLRIDVTPQPGNLFIQPRLKSSIKLTDALKINLGLGIYNQYVTQVELLDGEGNYHYLWDLYGSSYSTVLAMDMASLGLNFSKNGWHFNAETYYKRTEGLRRFITTAYNLEPYDGTSKAQGIDLLVKKDVAHHTFWVGYTNAKTVEYFDYFETLNFRPAMFDRRHQIKAAAITKIKSFRISANYQYGSKVPNSNVYGRHFGAYQRLDFTLNYSLIRDWWQADASLSLLNVFNQINRSSSNSSVYHSNNQSSFTITTSDVPFMPVVNLKMVF